LTTLFGSTEITTAVSLETPAPRKKLGWLPLLTVLFCLSYGLMTMLIVEQGSTIESQRALIRELFRDSTELSSMKAKAQIEKRAAQARNSQAGKMQAPSTQIPSNQVQTPSSQTPSNQAIPQGRPKNQVALPKQFQTPAQPASDQATNRRALVRI
jgi:hypothetical protein